MKHGETICSYAIFMFLTSSNASNLLGMYDEQTFVQRYAVDPVINYDSHERVWPPRLLRQGHKEPPTNATVIGTTSGTTIENAYIPYWPQGEWVFERYGEVCGRRLDMRFDWPAQYKTFVNLCEMDKWNWREGPEKRNRFYPVHMRQCRNTGGWSQQVTLHSLLVDRKRKWDLLLAKRLNATTTRLVNVNG